MMDCRKDCKWFVPEYEYLEERTHGCFERIREPPTCLFGGEPYKDTFPGEPCVGEYEKVKDGVE